jgi:serine/threonine protein kinase
LAFLLVGLALFGVFHVYPVHLALKLADFGVSCLVEETETFYTLRGTRHFAAPEVTRESIALITQYNATM